MPGRARYDIGIRTRDDMLEIVDEYREFAQSFLKHQTGNVAGLCQRCGVVCRVQGMGIQRTDQARFDLLHRMTLLFVAAVQVVWKLSGQVVESFFKRPGENPRMHIHFIGDRFAQIACLLCKGWQEQIRNRLACRASFSNRIPHGLNFRIGQGVVLQIDFGIDWRIQERSGYLRKQIVAQVEMTQVREGRNFGGEIG